MDTTSAMAVSIMEEIRAEEASAAPLTQQEK